MANPATKVKGYKYRFYPNKAQRELLKHSFGCARFAYNQVLKATRLALEARKTDPTLLFVETYYDALEDHLLPLKAANPWLANVSSVILQQSLMRLAKAYKASERWTNIAGSPRTKKPIGHQSITLTKSAFSCKDGKYYMAKCKDSHLKIRWSRELPSEPTSITITRTPSGEYYASFVCEYYPEPNNGSDTLGLDLGVKRLATMSDETEIPNPSYYVKSQTKLAKRQRCLSRKKPGSNGYYKCRASVARAHRDIANQRRDYCHKESRKLVNRARAICLEGMNISELVKSNHIAKHILDASMGQFREFIKYKGSDSQHCSVLIADPYYPSTQLCSNCGLPPTIKIKRGITEWECEHCYTPHGRDLNAAKNLLQHLLANRDLWENDPGAVIDIPAYAI